MHLSESGFHKYFFLIQLSAALTCSCTTRSKQSSSFSSSTSLSKKNSEWLSLKMIHLSFCAMIVHGSVLEDDAPTPITMASPDFFRVDVKIMRPTVPLNNQ